MIVSVSRRTDIAAFYSKWFVNRVRAGWCLVPNPFNPQQTSRVALSASEVDAFVFWSRDPHPLIKHLGELDDLGLRYYFLFTLVGYPRGIDPGAPSPRRSIKTFLELSARVGPEKTIWRYDPIVLSDLSGVGFHERNFRRLAGELRGAAKRCVISFVQPYQKARARMEAAAPGWRDRIDFSHPQVRGLLGAIAQIAGENGMQMFSCATGEDYSAYGIKPSRCVDAELISKLFGMEASTKKDPYQRKECGCAASRDIGMYDTCLFGCSYCYATTSFERAKANHARHDPDSPSLLPVAG
ncbi:MAG: DUF1848 domain-containing protein [Syntrophobacteraceae bacterium]|nr:DUF1848 domain-containing protein [Syntrophobacteraceae bacterium]